jgi:hypothetical protein
LVRCDPEGDIRFIKYSVCEDYIRAWPNATSAPAFDCPLNEPPGRVTRTTPAAVELFKRVIYENFSSRAKSPSVTAPLKVGVTFREFEMGKPFINRVRVDPGRGAVRTHDGAPVDATVYPVRVKFNLCQEYAKSIGQSVEESEYACFKDKFGDWVCAVNRVLKFSERQTIPKDKQ